MPAFRRMRVHYTSLGLGSLLARKANCSTESPFLPQPVSTTQTMSTTQTTGTNTSSAQTLEAGSCKTKWKFNSGNNLKEAFKSLGTTLCHWHWLSWLTLHCISICSLSLDFDSSNTHVRALSCCQTYRLIKCTQNYCKMSISAFKWDLESNTDGKSCWLQKGIEQSWLCRSELTLLILSVKC